MDKRPLTKPARPGGRRPRTLGPVSDLERHLPAEWWRELFDSVYLRTDGDVVENDANTMAEVDLLVQATGLQIHDRLLDLCCGQGRHAIELARRGFKQVVGIDRSRYLVRLARRRAKKLGLEVSFREGDARKFKVPEGSFDVAVVMGNSFGYFDVEEADAKVLEAVKTALRSGGTLVLDLTDGEWMQRNFEPRSWEWIDQSYFVCRERSLASDGTRLVSREVVVHAERGVIADQFYAERLYTRERILNLLERLELRNARIHESLRAESTRGQDLGMMAHRLFITAQAPRKTIVQAVNGKDILPVTVVLGDPRLPDTVKRGGVFNLEDMQTVERLKDALSELRSFHFSYLDNHVTLGTDLRANPPQLIFNLCDEGFNNDAFLELHVPALLELLGIPYTGAGPAGLALCYDKSLVRALAHEMDIPVPLETYVNPGDQSATLPSMFPALLKPNFGDSSIGITKDAVVSTPAELVSYLTELLKTYPGCPVLVQEFLSGAEYSVGLIGNPVTGLRALPILEVDYSHLDPGLPRLLGYESKWEPDSPYWMQLRYKETDLPESEQRTLIEWSTRLFERLRCRDYARFDFRADGAGTIKLLEVNPNPGWCWDGKFNIMAGWSGLSYAKLLAMIIEAATERLGLQHRSVSQPAAAS
ncbi:MAG: methyltransferase domain-containing protein, partial [Gammaproteobacteria bacterium]